MAISNIKSGQTDTRSRIRKFLLFCRVTKPTWHHDQLTALTPPMQYLSDPPEKYFSSKHNIIYLQLVPLWCDFLTRQLWNVRERTYKRKWTRMWTKENAFKIIPASIMMPYQEFCDRILVRFSSEFVIFLRRNTHRESVRTLWTVVVCEECLLCALGNYSVYTWNVHLVPSIRSNAHTFWCTFFYKKYPHLKSFWPKSFLAAVSYFW